MENREKLSRNKRRLIFKVCLILFALSVAVSLSSCSSGSGPTDGDDANSGSQIPLPYEISIKEELPKDGENDIVLMYPQIKYEGKEETAAEINEMLNDFVMAEFKKTGLDSSGVESYSYVTESVLITLKRKGFFSAVMSGYYISDAALHQEYFTYSVNFDIDNVKFIEAEDVIGDFVKIRGLFLDGKFALADGIDDLLEETTYSDMFVQYRADYNIYPGVYFTSSSMGIIVEVVYLLGGTACFEIPYAEVAEYINADLTAITDIVGK